jgi:hypothetical protein
MYCSVGTAMPLPTVTALSAILAKVPESQFLGGFHHERKSEPLHHEHDLASRRPHRRRDHRCGGRLAGRPAGTPGRGRFLRQRPGGRDRVSRFAPDRSGAGGTAKFMYLPALGIKGNSHMMMMDKNNLQIADLIIDWLGQSTALAKN